MTEQQFTVQDVLAAEHSLEPLVCVYCDSDEVVFHQSVQDAKCMDCGRWQLEGMSKAWYVKFPNQPYANGPVRFDEPVDRDRMMEWVRSYLTVDGEQLPIPEGTEVWPTS